MSLTHIQTKNVDQGTVRLLLEDTASSYQLGPSIQVEGVQDAPMQLDIDSAENKTEAYIQALYGRIMKGMTSLTIGKFPLEGLKTIVGAELVENAGVDVWVRVRQTAQLPYLALDYISKFIPGLEGQARLRISHRRCKCSSFSFTLGQDNFATVEMEFNTEFTRFSFGDSPELVEIRAEKIPGDLEDLTSYFPVRQHLPLWAPDASQGFTARTIDTDYLQDRAYKSETEGDYLEWTRPMAGTQLLTLYGQRQPSGGKIAVKLDGELIANADLYDDPAEDNYKFEISIPDVEPGFHALRLEIVTANGSSSGDLVELSSAELVAQAASLQTSVNTLPIQAQAAYEVPAFQYSRATPAPTVVADATNGAEKIEQDGLGSVSEYSLTVEPGTYSIKAVLGKGADYGTLAFSVGSTTVGTFDGYAASTATPTLASIPGTFTVLTRQRITVKISCTTKNGTSTGYKRLMAWLGLYRTASEAFDGGATGQTEILLLPFHAETQTGWTGASANVVRNWATVSDGTINRELVWKVGLLQGTWRARLAAEIEASGAALELSLGATKVCDFDLDGTADTDGRLEDTFEVDTPTLANISLKNPTTTAATVYYLFLERIA